MQDKTSNHAPIPTELNIAPRGKSWLHGQLIDGEQGHPTRQSMESADRAQAIEAAPAQAAPAAVAVPDGWKLVPVDLTPEMKREFMDLLMDGIDIYVNRRDQIEIQTDSPRRIWKAVLALSPAAPKAQADGRDADGEAFRTAAHLGLTLRFYGNCAQSGMPGTPSAYEITHGQDRAAAMREAIQRADAAIAQAAKQGGA